MTRELIGAGEKITKTLRYSREDIAQFARLTHDDNPLHHDVQAAQRAGFGDVIAAGQHTAGIMMGLMATHFSRRDDGVLREMLCLNLNFAYKQPVLAGQELLLSWQVASVSPSTQLGGLLAHLDGAAATPQSKAAVVARATILVRAARE